jgi:hypothetical protein
MIPLRWYNALRCHVGCWLMRLPTAKRIALARLVMPDTTSLVRHRPRRPPSLPLPSRSHLIYHQSAVDALCVRNCLESLAPQIPPEDEVLFLDVGGTASPEVLVHFSHHAWRGYAACETPRPEQRSYTFGLNSALAGLKAPLLFVWRTDYVFPAGVMTAYLRSLAHARFASPYEILIGLPETDSRWVRDHWTSFAPFDEPFWREHGKSLSLYETQDPALFAIQRELWSRIGGLNHELWGYGWQFAEFAARVRAACPTRYLDYFRCPPPFHQTHQGSQMYEPAAQRAEAEEGRRRFAHFLGGEAAYATYRLMGQLPPRPRD